MSEHSEASVTRIQLHLRVSAELVELIDAARGPATRNAYAAMLLERALAAVPGEGRTAARAPRRTEPRVEASEVAPVLPSVPDLGVPLTVASALPAPKRADCPHRTPRGAWCKLCQAKA